MKWYFESNNAYNQIVVVENDTMKYNDDYYHGLSLSGIDIYKNFPNLDGDDRLHAIAETISNFLKANNDTLNDYQDLCWEEVEIDSYYRECFEDADNGINRINSNMYLELIHES